MLAELTGLLPKYLFVLGVGAGLTLALTPLFMRVAARLGLVDMPGGRHTHAHPVPLCGGPALFLAFQVTVLAVYAMPWGAYSGRIAFDDWLRFLLVSSLVLALGIVDDRLRLRPYTKLAGQVALASVVFLFGTRFGKVLDIPLHPLVSYLATVAWLVGAMNAFNLIDGMDGLAAGLGLIGATGMALVALFTRNLSDALFMLTLASVCGAFLRFNLHPARAFLGESGSTFIGFTLAWFALRTGTKAPTLTALLVPVLAMGVPFLDAFLAVWRRSVRHLFGRQDTATPTSLVDADQEHLHHRLRAAGLSPRNVTLTLYAIAAGLVGVGLLAMLAASHRVAILMAAFAVFSYVVIRHLARVELWDSTRLVVRGLHRPAPRVLAVLLYPPLDVLLLCGAFAVVAVLVRSALGFEHARALWRQMAPVGVGIPFLGIACSSAYRRVWSRARVTEYGILLVWLMGGILLACVALELLYGLPTTTMLTALFVYLGAALPGILLVRVLPRLLQDMRALLRRTRKTDRATDGVLLYGAGYTATLFLRQRSFADMGDTERHQVRGLIDDDRNLLGRIVHSHRVLGAVDDLPELCRRYGVTRIIVTAQLDDANQAKLMQLAPRLGVAVFTWRPVVARLAPTEPVPDA